MGKLIPECIVGLPADDHEQRRMNEFIALTLVSLS
jgi:hypothetical protein